MSLLHTLLTSTSNIINKCNWTLISCSCSLWLTSIILNLYLIKLNHKYWTQYGSYKGKRIWSFALSKSELNEDMDQEHKNAGKDTLHKKTKISKDYSSVPKPYRELSSIYYVFQIENSWRFLIISRQLLHEQIKKLMDGIVLNEGIAWRMQRKPLDQVVERCDNKAVIGGSIQVGNHYFLVLLIFCIKFNELIFINFIDSCMYRVR